MKLQQIALLACAGVALAACGSDTGGVTTTNPPLAYVRYVHAMPDTGTVDLRVVDKVENLNAIGVPYGYVTAYQGVEAGSRHFKVFMNLNSTDIAVVSQTMKDTTAALTAGTYYTLLHTGFSRTGATPHQTIQVITETPPAAPAAGKYAVRIYPAAPYAGGVDVYFTPDTNPPAVGSTPVATNLRYGSPTPFIVRDTSASTANLYVQVYPTGAAVGTATGRILPYPPDGLPASSTQVLATRWNAATVIPGAPGIGAASAAPGHRISASAFTMFYFPPGVAGSMTQSITSTGPLKGVSYATLGWGIDHRP